MAAYRFFEIDAAGRHPYRVVDCADDAEALSRAGAEAVEKGCTIEVWQDRRLVGKRGRP